MYWYLQLFSVSLCLELLPPLHVLVRYSAGLRAYIIEKQFYKWADVWEVMATASKTLKRHKSLCPLLLPSVVSIVWETNLEWSKVANVESCLLVWATGYLSSCHSDFGLSFLSELDISVISLDFNQSFINRYAILSKSHRLLEWFFLGCVLASYHLTTVAVSRTFCTFLHWLFLFTQASTKNI